MKNLLLSLLRPSQRNASQRPAAVAHNLMTRANAEAGHEPHHAAELRQAAMAYLRVVR